MAKKVVATLRTLGKEYSKVIRMKKSEKTGAYYFEETIVPMDSVQEFIRTTEKSTKMLSLTRAI